MNGEEALAQLVAVAHLDTVDQDVPIKLALDSLQIAELSTIIGRPPGTERDFADMTLRELAAEFAMARAHTGLTNGNSPAAKSEVPVARHNELVVLRPVGPAHMPFLYDLATDEQVGFRWRFRSVPPDVDTFAQRLWPGVLVQFCVHLRADDRPIGLVVCYNAEFTNLHAYIGAVFSRDAQHEGIGISAVRLFLEYVFNNWPMRKLYFEVPAYNYPQFASGEGWRFQVEGRLREHEFYAGRYWDKLYLAVYPEQLMVKDEESYATGRIPQHG